MLCLQKGKIDVATMHVMCADAGAVLHAGQEWLDLCSQADLGQYDTLSSN